MKSLKPVVPIAALAALLAVTLSACGGENTPADTAAVDVPDSLTDVEAVETEAVTDIEADTVGTTACDSMPIDEDTAPYESVTHSAGAESESDEPVTAESEPFESDRQPDETVPETEPLAPVIPDDALDVTAYGVTKAAGHALENSLALTAMMGDLPDHSTVYFPEGTYEVAFPIYIIGKQNIRMVGENATLLRTGTVNTTPIQPPLQTDALPAEHLPLTSSTSFIVATDNQGLCVEGLTFAYDTPTSLSGKIVSVNDGTAIIELTDQSSVTGGEYATVINTFTADGLPDRVLEQYAETAFSVEKLDEKTIRVSGLAPGGASNLRAGTRVCLRLCTGRDYVIVAQRSSNLTFKNLHLQSSYNGGILLTERCGDATLENIRVQSANPEALMSLNADALHIADMTGTLTVDGCTFDRPGDDCINVHSGAYVVEAVEGSTVIMSSPRFGNSPVWALVGDTLNFFDPATFAVVARAKVTAVDGKNYTVDAPAGVTVGCVVANTATRPVVTVRNTTASNTRARGFLLQTDQATVENCTFTGTALSAILVASDVDTWFEMSPVRELIIRNNTFESCGYYAAGVIQITASHDNPNKTYDRIIHGRIDIMGNTFASLQTPAVYALCTHALTVTDNIFSEMTYRDAYLWVVSCETVKVSGIEKERIVSDRVDFLVTE